MNRGSNTYVKKSIILVVNGDIGGEVVEYDRVCFGFSPQKASKRKRNGSE